MVRAVAKASLSPWSARMDSTAAAAQAPVLLVTNDDGIDAPGLRFLVDQLVAARCYRVLVCAPDS